MTYDAPSRLAGEVRLRFRSISALARAAGWSYATTYRAVTGTRDLTQTEIRTLIRLLNLTEPVDIVRIFALTEEEHTT